MNQIATISERIPTPQTESAAIISVIERAARDPSVDLDKLERLMALHERAAARQAELAFNDAMSSAQSEMRPVAADSNNPQTKSKYASYHALDKALRPIYTRHGFSISYDTDDSPKPDHIRIVAYVTNAWHKRTYKVDMPADGKGAKGGDVMTKTHAAGAAFSYGCRYLLKMIFNVSIGEDDDDGNDSAGTISDEQAEWLRTLVTEVGADITKFLAFMKVESLTQIQARDYDKAVRALEAKRAKG